MKIPAKFMFMPESNFYIYKIIRRKKSKPTQSCYKVRDLHCVLVTDSDRLLIKILLEADMLPLHTVKIFHRNIKAAHEYSMKM
jgi:hypothetical protein